MRNSMLLTPPKARPGDRVAVLSPSWAAPGAFPEVHERSMRALRHELRLVPVEFPTTRQLGASPQERANDVMAAFADPKPFFGYSDNTNLLNWLWNLGVVSYHGGSTMVHLARAGGTHAVSLESLRRALFTTDTVAIDPVGRFTDRHPDWRDLSTLAQPLPETDEPGWVWLNAEQVVSGPTWGGNLEILHWNLAANRWIDDVGRYAGCILLLETSEEMPPAQEVYRMLRNTGERGLLSQFPAVVIAKPKAWNREQDQTPAESAAFRADQYAAVQRAFAEYNPQALIVCGPDFGHTDPQHVVPYGGQMTVDGPARRITVTY